MYTIIINLYHHFMFFICFILHQSSLFSKIIKHSTHTRVLNIYAYVVTHANIVSSPPETGGTKNFAIFSLHSCLSLGEAVQTYCIDVGRLATNAAYNCVYELSLYVHINAYVGSLNALQRI